jgi:hypothetical protein
MRGRDGRPHPQKTGEFLFKRKKPAPPAKLNDPQSFWRIAQRPQDASEFFENQRKKHKAQAETPETSIFKSCVFYFLGFTGRGKDSRYNMNKVIEQNGGRSAMFLTGQVTHVLTRGVCHRKKEMLEPWVEGRKISVVSPDFVDRCIQAGKLLPADRFPSVQWGTNRLEAYCAHEAEARVAVPN